MTARGHTRRELLRALAVGGAGLASGLPPLGCALGGARPADGSSGRSLRLVFYTDVHARTEWDTPLALERATAAINARRPDLVISGGDLITDGFQSSAQTVEPRWEAYMAMYRGIERDVYPAIGNHDLVAALPEDGTPPSADPRAIYRERMGLERTWYAFDAAGYRFLVLDPIDVIGGELKYQGRVGEEQLEWLRGELARTPRDTPFVLVTHMPLLTGFYAATQGLAEPAPRNRVVTNNTEVLDLFEDRRLVLVLQGHLHVFEMLRWRGTTFVTGGAICGKWWRGAYFDTPEGFCEVTLSDDRVESEYLSYGWEARRPRTG